MSEVDLVKRKADEELSKRVYADPMDDKKLRELETIRLLKLISGEVP